MDLNKSFESYDIMDGANCQTVLPKRQTQREAAIDAVREIGMNQICEIREEMFRYAPQWKDMFFSRLEELKIYDRGDCTKR